MIIEFKGEYKIIKERSKNRYVVANIQGNYENHGHFNNISTCYLIINLLQKHKIPKSNYLLEAAIRITTDEKYKAELIQVQMKRKKKLNYYNKKRRTYKCGK